eukprot:180093-Prymnesium_polylepis.1
MECRQAGDAAALTLVLPDDADHVHVQGVTEILLAGDNQLERVVARANRLNMSLICAIPQILDRPRVLVVLVCGALAGPAGFDLARILAAWKWLRHG